MTPSFCEAPAHFQRFAHDRRPILRARGKLAAEIGLTAGPAEHLIVGRQRFDLAERRHSQLSAGTPKIAAGDQFLDDAARLGELVGVAVPRHLGRFELHRLHALHHAVFLCRIARRRRRRQVDVGVPEARHALIEFRDHLLDRRFLFPHRDDRVDEIVRGMEILDAERIRDALFPEHLPRSALGAEMEGLRIGAVHRNAQRDRQFPFHAPSCCTEPGARGWDRESAIGCAEAAVADPAISS